MRYVVVIGFVVILSLCSFQTAKTEVFEKPAASLGQAPCSPACASSRSIFDPNPHFSKNPSPRDSFSTRQSTNKPDTWMRIWKSFWTKTQ